MELKDVKTLNSLLAKLYTDEGFWESSAGDDTDRRSLREDYFQVLGAVGLYLDDLSA